MTHLNYSFEKIRKNIQIAERTIKNRNESL